MRSNTTTIRRRNSRRGSRRSRSNSCSSPARSTAPPGTRKRRARGGGRGPKPGARSGGERRGAWGGEAPPRGEWVTALWPRGGVAPPEARGDTVGEAERVGSVARRPGVSLGALLEAAGVTITADEQSVASAEIELKYDGYLAREREAAARLAELAAFVLPADLPYLELKSLATEARQKLDRVRPSSLAQAARIPGVSPSDLHNLVVEAARRRRHVA